MTASALAEDCSVVSLSPAAAPALAPGARGLSRLKSERSRLLARVGGVTLLAAGLVGAVLALVGLAGAAKKAPWTELLASPGALVVMVSAMVIGYLMQSLTLRTLISRRLPARECLMLPWACSSVNRVTPGATGGLLLATRVLHRRGVTLAGAAVFLAGVGITHTLAGLLVLGIAIGTSGMTGQYGIPLGGAGFFLSFLGVGVFAVLACIPRTRARVLDMLRQARGELVWRRLPFVLIFQAGARLAPAVVLAGALSGLGHPLPLSTVVVVVLVAGATGSLIPLPGGGGGVELALTGLLTASGLSLGDASAAVLVARLVGFWLPAALGLPALLALRRSVATLSAAEAYGAEVAVNQAVSEATPEAHDDHEIHVTRGGLLLVPAAVSAAA